MDAAEREQLSRLEFSVGELRGELKAATATVERLSGAIDTNQRATMGAHRAQDDRIMGLAAKVETLTAISEAMRSLGERVVVLEQAKSKADGERQARAHVGEWVRVMGAAAAAAIATWFAGWKH